MAGPGRVQWLLGSKVLRTGPGTLEVPEGTTRLKAKDPRRQVTTVVPIVDGAADYGDLPQAQILARARPWAQVSLGSEALGQTPLAPVGVVAGRYTVTFKKDGVVVVRSVDVDAETAAAGGVVKVNVDMESPQGGTD